MKAVSHANPYTGETAGQLFNRGPIVAADGGRANAADDERAADDDERARERANAVEEGRAATDGEESPERMRDVSHTPPNESDDANRVFERGGREDGDRVEYEE